MDTAKYKQMLWNTVKEILYIAGYSVEDLSNEFGVKNPKKNNKKSEKTMNDEDGHGNA